MNTPLFIRSVMRYWPKAFLAVAALSLFCSCEPKKSGLAIDQQTEPVVTNAPASAARPNPAFDKLVGRWERPDGGYILDISGVEPDGRLKAAYLNPNGPINVSRALGVKEGTTTKVFVELRDTGYPGCTYSLTYDPQTDQLFGEYFQAAMQETFNVTFARLKNP